MQKLEDCRFWRFGNLEIRKEQRRSGSRQQVYSVLVALGQLEFLRFVSSFREYLGTIGLILSPLVPFPPSFHIYRNCNSQGLECLFDMFNSNFDSNFDYSMVFKWASTAQVGPTLTCLMPFFLSKAMISLSFLATQMSSVL